MCLRTALFFFSLFCGGNALRLPPLNHEDVPDMEMNKVLVHSEYIQKEKHEAMFIANKAFETIFKIGREGSDKCLAFLHVPKTAGTSIESQNKHTVRSTHPSARHWGKFDSNLDCEVPFNNHLTGCRFSYQKNGETHNATCHKWHVPPHVDKRLAASYVSDGCETFCVVRSPSDRFASELKYQSQQKMRKYRMESMPYDPELKKKGWCSEEWYTAKAMDDVAMTRKQPYFADCHMVSQTEYIYGDSDKPQFCTHQLRMENLKEDFGSLMKKFDIPLELTEHERDSEAKFEAKNCEIDVEKTKAKPIIDDFVKEYYADDLKNFHYAL